LGRDRQGGLIVMPDIFTLVHRAPIIGLAAQNNVPAVYWNSVFAREGGLLSYGPDRADIFRRSANYIYLILRGRRPAELPVQLPIKWDLTLNAKTAKALSLEIPVEVLALTNEVIE